jgi:hypothetical protein
MARFIPRSTILHAQSLAEIELGWAGVGEVPFYLKKEYKNKSFNTAKLFKIKKKQDLKCVLSLEHSRY